MSVAFVSYLWHYLAAREIYDEVLAPISRGHIGGLLMIVLIAVASFALGRRSGRRRAR